MNVQESLALPRARDTIGRITPYVPGKSIEEVAAEYGVRDVVKLASNENPLGPSPRALEAVRNGAGEIFRYPDGASGELIALLAERLDVPQDHLVVGNGSDEVIKLLAEAYLEPGDEVIYADPTFSEYAYVARLMGAAEIPVPLDGEWVHDLEAMLSKVTDRTKLVFICNPNNPTGTIVSHERLERFLAALPPQAIMVCDEAYVEYVDDASFPDSLGWVREGKPVVVLRTFSKVYGLAGLRIGYGIAPPYLIENIRRVKEPFNVNRLAQAAACEALRDEEHVGRSVRLNAEERERLRQRLETLGCTVTPSQANFLWVDLGRDCRPVLEALLQRGVIIRGGDAFGQPHHVRITIGKKDENDKLLRNLEQVLL